MRHGATDAEVQRVVAVIEEMGYRAHPMPGSQRTAVGLVGNDGRVDASRLEGLPGVQEVIQVTKPYKQVSREWKADSTVVQLGGGVTIGGDGRTGGAGPAEAGAVGGGGGAAPRRGVRAGRGKPRGDSVRARHPRRRSVHAQRVRPRGSTPRMPRSHRITSRFPSASTYSAERSSSSTAADIPRFDRTGFLARPATLRCERFCMLRAPSWMMCATSATWPSPSGSIAPARMSSPGS